MLDAIIQGILQGLTEFLPISSSGHLALYQYFTGSSGETGLSLTVFLHFGTLLAVFFAFYKTIFDLIREVFVWLSELLSGRLKKGPLSPLRRMIILLIVSFIPLLLFLPFKDFFEGIATSGNILPIGINFLITAALLLLADRLGKGSKTAANMTIPDALLVGAAQGVALLPGVSRSGATISTGLLAGLSKEYAVSFSFIMGIPAVLGANVLETVKLIKDSGDMNLVNVIVGMLVAAIAGFAAIKLVRWLVKSDKLKWFGYYTLVLGVVSIVLGFIK